MKKLKTLIIALALALALFSSGSAGTNDKPVITIAGIENFRPYSYTENNRPEGLYNDIVRELFSRAGYSVKIKLMPFKRILSMTKQGDVTGMAGTFFTPDRGKFATFLKDIPLTIMHSSLFVTKGSPIQTPDLSELKGKMIGHKRGFIMSPELDSGAKNGVFQEHEVESVEQMVKMLIAGRLDAFCNNTANALYYIDRLDKEKTIQLLPQPVTDARKTYVAFSKKALKKLPGNFVATVQTAFISMVSDGTFKNINIKHNIAYE